MKTKSLAKRAVCLVLLMTAGGCRTPGAMGQQGMSASENSSDGSNSNSGSGESSGDSNHSSNESGESSEGSNHSSEEGGSSESRSSKQSESGSSESESGGEGKDSRSETSNRGNKDGRIVSATTVAATVLGLGVVIWRAYVASERRERARAEEVGRAAQVYLRARTHQLREDLALGAGPTVEDLAEAAHIRRENLGTFGRLLRTHRRELLEMADARTLTPDRALAWLERVGELARSDARLDEDRRAFLSARNQEASAEVAR
ncbi:hypothetical protein LZ198_12555 [Myxococcus sp. K15C18031901]|uniref:hypothetical protein n=1 Tax=Myxococcus dinghuensis TaxID=2906761 RepID=UPI0020A7469A|nr:hypothetical protein [Myxococcus dinghuensis]MCP3099699.1 hypothetical protein [Myxococcus dinghuensis]